MVTTGTYVEVIEDEAVQRDALDSMGALFEHVGDDSSAGCRHGRQTPEIRALKTAFLLVELG